VRLQLVYAMQSTLCSARTIAAFKRPRTVQQKRTVKVPQSLYLLSCLPRSYRSTQPQSMPKMAATTPIRPVAPEMYTPLAELLALEEALLPLPELVPGDSVPVPPGLDSPPEHVYVPLITLLLPERGWKWLQELEMSLVDWRLKAPRISEIAGRDTLLYVSYDGWS